MFYHHNTYSKPAQALIFNVTDIEGSMLLGGAETLLLGVMLARDKLDKSLPRCTKNVISQDDRSDAFAINRKTQDSSAEQPVNQATPK